MRQSEWAASFNMRALAVQKVLLDNFAFLEYTKFVYFDGNENFDIRIPSESRWQVKTGGSTISFHFPDKD